MSTLSYCGQQFQQDFKQLETDAKAYHHELKELTKAESSLQTEISSLANKYKDHPGELLAIIIVKVLGTRRDKVFQVKLQVKADAVQVQGDVTKLTNDIQGTITKYSTDDATNGSSGFSPVLEVNSETDEMCYVFNSAETGTPNSNTFTWAKYVSAPDGAIGTQGSSMLYTNFKKIRDTIYNPNDLSNNGTGTYYFKIGSPASSTPAHFYSFYAMNEALDNPSETLHADAQTVNSTIVNNYNEITSATQSLGTAVNSEIGLITSTIKMNTSAESDFAQDLLTADRTAINNEIPRG